MQLMKNFQATSCLRLCMQRGYSCRNFSVNMETMECKLNLDQSELNFFEKESNSNTELSKTNIFVFYEKHIDCREVFCENGGTCINTKPDVFSNIAYKCHCVCGSCGQKCEKRNFRHVPNKGIAENNIAEVEVFTVDQCLDLCRQNNSCKSVDFSMSEKICYLNAFNHEEKILHSFDHIDYYYPNCHC
ncbi:uncharacterized protein [Centruroides vittatus]|uniref:uncharacterized protein n=1 Tax=Centruroides vittatus TaxID=120091 RepID=UPI0035106EAD